MALQVNTFDTIPDGTAISSANMATYGFTTASLGGGTVTGRSAAALQGARGIELVAAAAATTALRQPITNNKQQSISVLFKLVSGTGNNRVFAIRHGGGYILSLNWDVTNTRFILNDSSGAGLNLLTTGAATGTWYRLDVVFNTGTGAADGSYTAHLYLGLNTSPIGTTAGNGYRTSAASNLASGAVATHVEWTVANGIVVQYDTTQFDDGGTSELGPYVGAANVAPTVSAGSNQNVSAAATVNLSASATDTDGTIASYAWTFDYPTSGAPSLTGGSTATPSFTAGSAGALYILRCTVTDDQGATAFSTVEVRVPIAGATTGRTIPQNGSGTSWTIGGGSGTDGAALNDETDTTYVESPTVTGSEQARRWRLQPSATKASGVLKLRLWTDSGTANSTIRLIEGNTTRQTWTQALTSTPAEYSFTLSAGTLSAISDWGNLYFEVGVTS